MGLGAGCPRTPPALSSGAGGSRVLGGGGAGEPQASESTALGWAGLGGAASGGCGDTAPPQGDPSPAGATPAPGGGHGEGWGSARCLGWLWCPQSLFPGPPHRAFRGAVAHAAWPRCWGCSVPASAGGGFCCWGLAPPRGDVTPSRGSPSHPATGACAAALLSAVGEGSASRPAVAPVPLAHVGGCAGHRAAATAERGECRMGPGGSPAPECLWCVP